MATGEVLQDQDWNEGSGAPAETVAKIDSFTQEAQALTGPEAIIGEGKDDPAKRYSGVEFVQGDVIEDQDWNEGGGTPTETVAKIDSFTHEMQDVDALYQDEVGLDFKPIPAGETGEGRSPSEGVSKIDAFTHEMPDREASGNLNPEVALDGKGGDITEAQLEPEAALDREAVIPKLEVAQDSRKVEEGENIIPKLEIGAVGPDFKFFTSDSSEGISGTPLDAKDPAYLREEGLLESKGLEEVLGRAVTDSAFRQQFTTDAESVLAEFNLTDDEIGMLSRVDPDRLEEIAGQLQAQFRGGEDQETREAQGRMLSELLWGSDTEGHMPGAVDADGVEHEDSWKGE